MKSWYLYVSIESSSAGFFSRHNLNGHQQLRMLHVLKWFTKKSNAPMATSLKNIVTLIKYSTNYYILSAKRFEQHTFWVPIHQWTVRLFFWLIKLPYSNLYNLFNGPEMKKKHFKWVHLIYSEATGNAARINSRLLMNDSQFNRDYVTSGWKREWSLIRWFLFSLNVFSVNINQWSRKKKLKSTELIH